MPAKVLLLHAQPRSVSTGVRANVRMAGGGADYPYRYGANDWRAGLTAAPTITTLLEYTGDDMGNGAVPQAMTLEWAPARASILAAALGLVFEKAPFTLYWGDENAAGTLPAVLLSGTILSSGIVEGRLQMAIADPATDLQRPVLTATFAGTGGVEGPSDWEGRAKRRAWGQVFNVEGFCIDSANNVYSFGDPSKPWEDFVDVRDKGASAASLTTVAWAGSVAATYAALQVAVAPPGGGVKAPSIAMVKWWTRPAGILAADVKGENSGGYVEKAADIAQAIVSARGGPAFKAGTVAACNSARPDACGLLVDDMSTQIGATLDYLLGGVSTYWLLESGEIRLGQWEFGSSAASFQSAQVDRRQAFAPVARRSIGYKRNHRVHSAGDIAGIVTYADGTSIDDLQPAEAGATVGAPAGTPVGSITADDVADTIASGGGVAADQVSTASLQANSATAGGSFWHDFAGGLTIGASGTWEQIDDGVNAAEVTVSTGPLTSQQVIIQAAVGVRRAGGANDDVSFKMKRSSDGAFLTQVYSVEATNDKAVQPFTFHDPDPPNNTAVTYELWWVSDDAATPAYEVFLHALLTKTG